MQEINRTIVAVAALVALAAVTAVWIWSSNNRYYVISTMNASRLAYQHVYEIDKRTGRIWIVHSSGKQLVPAAWSPVPAGR